jgi:hypothetical protein
MKELPVWELLIYALDIYWSKLSDRSKLSDKDKIYPIYFFDEINSEFNKQINNIETNLKLLNELVDILEGKTNIKMQTKNKKIKKHYPLSNIHKTVIPFDIYMIKQTKTKSFIFSNNTPNENVSDILNQLHNKKQSISSPFFSSKLRLTTYIVYNAVCKYINRMILNGNMNEQKMTPCPIPSDFICIGKYVKDDSLPKYNLINGYGNLTEPYLSDLISNNRCMYDVVYIFNTENFDSYNSNKKKIANSIIIAIAPDKNNKLTYNIFYDNIEHNIPNIYNELSKNPVSENNIRKVWNELTKTHKSTR